MIKQFNVMYTTQKTKKKKVWHCGALNLNELEGKGVLYAKDEEEGKIRMNSTLETRYLSPKEIQDILSGNITE